MKKYVSKSLSWVLVCVLIMAQLLVPVQAAATRTVYVDITGTDWRQVNVYTWDASGTAITGAWPGSAMTKVEETVYCYEVPTDAVNIIFNDGSNQTADLVIPTDGRNLYRFNINIWSTYTATDCTHSWSAGRCTLCGAVCDHNWIDGICKNCGSACGHKWSNGTCLVCNLICGHRNWVDGACVDCKLTCSHSFQNGMCSVCGVADTGEKAYYLFGWINGAAYGCEEDYENMGEYRFDNGTLTATFTVDSYVGIKTGDNADWYMTHGYSQGRAAVFYDTDTGVAEKLLVPGGAELTFTLTENPDGSLTLSYQGEVPECDHSYEAKEVYAATCTSYAVYQLTCSECGEYLNVTTQDLEQYWLSGVPAGMDSSDFTSGTVYRYRDLTADSWTRFSTKQVVYVDQWPAGFDTTNEKYAMYNNKADKASAFENAATRQVIDQDTASGYLYYHWCCEGDAYSVAEKNDTHNRFHVFFSNTPPSAADGYDSSDDSYRFDENYNTCDDCAWFFAVPVYSQVYSTYTADSGWSNWSDWSETTATASETRQVQSGIRYNHKAAAYGDHSYENGTCTLCGDTEAQDETAFYLVGYINGANYGCEEDSANMGDYKFADGKLVATFETDSYVFLKTEGNGKWLLAEAYCTDTVCTFYEGKSEKMLVPGGVELTFTLTENGDGSVTLSYSQNTVQCEHSYTSKVEVPVCNQPSITTYTCTLCGHSYTEEGGIWYHNYVNGTCTMCGGADPNYVVPKENIYLVGFINGANHGCEEDAANMGDYMFVDGKLVVTFTQDSYVFLKKQDNAAWYMSYTYGNGPKCNFYNSATNFVREKMLIPGGVEVTIYLSAGAGDSYLLSYTTPQMVCPHESHDLDGICTACGHQLVHLYVDGVCACGKVEEVAPVTEYFLFGYINGANYGCEEDYENMGEYKFVDGKLVATFTQDSYVGVKTTGNADWFMTNGYTGEYAVARLYNTKTLGNPNKLYVPGGVQVTFELVVNWDNTLSLSYTTAAASTVPTLALKGPTLEFKDMVKVIAFYTAENTQDVTEMGMITYSSNVGTADITTADNVIPGYGYDESTGFCFSASQGINAKYLGDTVYLAIYAKLTDGTYTYTKVVSYSPVTYAVNQLNSSSDTNLKQLVAAMLNYGSEAQLFFGHNTGSLANASLTAEQKALPAAYNSSMTTAVAAAPASKQGSLANNSGFASRRPAISFEGAFCINYFFTPNYAPDNGITLYYWNAADYAAGSVLTAANATGSIQMTGSGTSEYRADIEGIAAKNLSDAVYVAAVYTNGGTTWTSGVLGYSIGAYCASQISQGATVAALAKATAVYGYHAKAYFG